MQQRFKKNKPHVIAAVLQDSRLARIAISSIFYCFFFFLTPICFGDQPLSQDDGTTKFIQYLADEKVKLTIANNDAKLLQAEPIDSETLAKRKEQNTAMLTLMSSKIDNFENFLANQRKQQQNLASSLKKLQQAPLGGSDEMSVQERISKINNLNDANNKIIELISDNLTLAHRYQAALRIEARQLVLWQAKLNERLKEDELRKKINNLVEQRDHLYRKNEVNFDKLV